MENAYDWNRVLKSSEKSRAFIVWGSYYQGIGTLVRNGRVRSLF